MPGPGVVIVGFLSDDREEVAELSLDALLLDRGDAGGAEEGGGGAVVEGEDVLTVWGFLAGETGGG